MRSVDAAIDLLLAGSCAGCGIPGGTICRQCRAAVTGSTAFVVPWCAPLAAAHLYTSPIKGMMVAYKEQSAWSLGYVLGNRLARSVFEVASRCLDSSTRIVLVPAPSRARAVRERGLDTTKQLARVAVRSLKRAGVTNVGLRAALRFVREVKDQASLTRRERHANLGNSIRAAPLGPGEMAVIVDDITTTRATLDEAFRAARASGWAPVGAAVVAATPSGAQKTGI